MNFHKQRVGSRQLRFFGILLVALALVSGCGTGPETGGEGEPTLLLFCGAGIQKPVEEIIAAFREENGCRIEADFAGSEVLLSRITLKKKGDLYMPGDRSYIDLAARDGMIESATNVCYFVPAILVQKGNPKKIERLEDLTRNGIRLGLGDPKACAVGRQSIKIFKRNGISPEEIEKNLVFQSLTVNELGIQVQTGSLDAVIVWDAIAAQYLDHGESIAIPPEQNVISTVPVGVLSFSKHKDLAESFAAFAASERGRAIFRKHHYRVDPP